MVENTQIVTFMWSTAKSEPLVYNDGSGKREEWSRVTETYRCTEYEKNLMKIRIILTNHFQCGILRKCTKECLKVQKTVQST